MMRIGPWVLGTGLLLLVAGVVSTRADAWDTRIPALTIPLAMSGIDTIDIRASGIDKLVISSRLPAQVHYPEGSRFAWQDEKEQAAPPACHVTGATLRCKAGTQYLPGTPTMQLPPGRYRLLAGDVTILAQSDLESITLEVNGQVSWAGPVDALDVTLVPPPRTGKGDYPCSPPRFAFNGGRVRSLRIQAGAGSLNFDHLSEVGSIEVEAAQDVGLEVDKAADIARIKVLPLTAAAAAANAPADGDARDTCAGATNAAALAAMD
jgi:hypothetical protein